MSSSSGEVVEKRTVSFVENALISGTVCMGVSALLNPLDVAKIKLQNQSSVDGAKRYSGFMQGMKLIVKEEGWYGLTRGTEPAMYREIFYGSIRLGAYEPIRNFLSGNAPSETIHPAYKYGAALVTGAVGSALANPCDLVKTRFQAVTSNPGKWKTGLPYNNTFAGWAYIIKNEGGIKALYKGTSVTAARAALVTSSQIGTYDTAKNNILKGYFGFEEGRTVQFLSAMLAGAAVAVCSNPVDVIKSRYMADATEGEARRYKSVMDCVAKTFKNDGFAGFYKGTFTGWLRFGPHSFLSLIGIEKVRSFMNIKAL
jgi:hypothetical protein